MPDAQDRKAARRAVEALEAKEQYHTNRVAAAQHALAEATADATVHSNALTAARETLAALAQQPTVKAADVDSRHPWDAAPERRLKKVTRSPLGDRVEWELIPGQR